MSNPASEKTKETATQNDDIQDMESFIQKGIDSGLSENSPAEIFAKARQRVASGESVVSSKG